MKTSEIIKALRRMGVQTGSLVCLGCWYRHDCGVRGCAVAREAADTIEKLNNFTDSQCARLLVKLQEAEAAIPRWISVKDKMPENEQDVIICAERRHYSEPNRFIRIIVKAFYTDGKHDTEHTAYSWSNDYVDMEYDEENDAYKIPEGWWESVEYGEEFCAVSDFVTHWMPLPEPPEEVQLSCGRK